MNCKRIKMNLINFIIKLTEVLFNFLEKEIINQIALKKMEPIINESNTKFKKEEQKVKVLSEQLKALTLIFKNKKEEFELKIKKLHKDKLNLKNENQRNISKLEMDKLKMEQIINQIKQNQVPYSNLLNSVSKIKSNKKLSATMKKKKKSSNSSKPMKYDNSKLKLFDHSKDKRRLNQIQNTVNMIREQFQNDI